MAMPRHRKCRPDSAHARARHQHVARNLGYPVRHQHPHQSHRRIPRYRSPLHIRDNIFFGGGQARGQE